MKWFLALFLLAPVWANGQSSLPSCTSDQPSRWTNCFGSITYSNGVKYTGEFRDGMRHGQGAFYLPNGALSVSGTWAHNDLKSEHAIANYQSTASVQKPEGPQTSSSVTYPQISISELEIAKKRRQELEDQLVKERQEKEQLQSLMNSRLQSQNSVQSIGQGIEARNERRIALVIGNSNYRTRPLRNPVNDANDVSSALRSSGFQVIDLRDASLQQMRSGVRQFGDRLINNDVGLVYYSGHGVEVKGRNYFIPVNADIQREDEIADQGLDVSLVLEKMNTAGKGVNILIVDACRDDPFGRSFRSASRGLAQMDAPRGTIIAYATSPGKVAQDGDGRNSPYTKNLVRVMQQPNKPIEQVFKEVRRAVQEETKNQQTPWENTSLSGDFYFRIQR